MKHLLLFLLTMSTIYSCSNDTYSLQEIDNSKSQSLRQSNYSNCMSSFDNSINPFIWMADYHNTHVDQIGEAFFMNPTKEGFKSEVEKVAPYYNDLPFQFYGVLDKTETFHQYIERQNHYTDSAKEYTKQMLNVIDNDIDVIKEIQSIELEIMNDVDLNNIEKEGLLQGAAICQGSYCYWTNNSAKWLPEGTTSVRAPQWVKEIIKADFVAGVATAMAIGIGWVVPPAAVGGALATVGTAAGASAAMGIWMVGDYVLSQLTGWW